MGTLEAQEKVQKWKLILFLSPLAFTRQQVESSVYFLQNFRPTEMTLWRPVKLRSTRSRRFALYKRWSLQHAQHVIPPMSWVWKGRLEQGTEPVSPFSLRLAKISRRVICWSQNWNSAPSGSNSCVTGRPKCPHVVTTGCGSHLSVPQSTEPATYLTASFPFHTCALCNFHFYK